VQSAIDIRIIQINRQLTILQ